MSTLVIFFSANIFSIGGLVNGRCLRCAWKMAFVFVSEEYVSMCLDGFEMEMKSQGDLDPLEP